MDAPRSPPPREGPTAGNRPTGSRPVERWLCEARNGSRSALGKALEQGRNHLLQIARRSLDDKLRSKVGASDLVQDTFVAAQRDFGSFRGSTEEEFYGWLSGILAHRLANNARHYRGAQRRDVDRELPPAAVEVAMQEVRDRAATPGTRYIGDEEQRRVRLALARLDEPWQSVLVERTWLGHTFAEIGARHGFTDEAARKIWVRAVRRMRTLLAEIE